LYIDIFSLITVLISWSNLALLHQHVEIVSFVRCFFTRNGSGAVFAVMPLG
jgi:sulfur relay (sulfurtransferase) DsrC/TusE family protein